MIKNVTIEVPGNVQNYYGLELSTRKIDKHNEGVLVTWKYCHNVDLVNLYGCYIGAGTKIGTFTEIQKDVVVGKNCKIQSFVFIPTGVTIEDGVFIGPHVCFTNDKNPAAINKDGSLKSPHDWTLSETIVKKGANIGANATILPGITIGEGATIGAGSVVTKNVPAGETWVGNPAKNLHDFKEYKCCK